MVLGIFYIYSDYKDWDSKSPAFIAIRFIHGFFFISLKYCLVQDHEIAGSIPGNFTNFKCGLGLERGPPSLVRTIG